jgi:hypothetical protein
MGVSAHEADEGGVDRAGFPEREQIVQQPLAECAVLYGDGRGRHLTDEDGPQVRAVRSPVLQRQNRVEFPAGGVEVAGPGCETGRDGVGVRRGADPPLHRLRGHRAEFAGLVARPDDFESL